MHSLNIAKFNNSISINNNNSNRIRINDNYNNDNNSNTKLHDIKLGTFHII